MNAAYIKFQDNEDGTLAIQVVHEGEFVPTSRAHQAMAAVCSVLPQMFESAEHTSGTSADQVAV